MTKTVLTTAFRERSHLTNRTSNKLTRMLMTNKGKATTTKELIEGSIGVLIEALEAGRGEVLTAYLSAMAEFHYYSFGNVLLIAVQKPGLDRRKARKRWSAKGGS